MFALRVVEQLDLVERAASCFFTGLVFFSPDTLALEQVEEALHDFIVPAVATAAHAEDQVVAFQRLLPLVAGQLGTLVRRPAKVGRQTVRGGMHMDSDLGFAPPDGQE